MRILAGGPSLRAATGEDPELYEAWSESLDGQRLPPGFTVDVMAVPDWEGAAIRDYDPTSDLRARWSDAAMSRVGWLRQQFADYARNHGFDACWLVDDDIIASPHALAQLLRVEAPIVYGVFWTVDNQGVSRQQTWTHMPGSAPDAYIEAIRAGHILECYGGGACTLIRRDAFPVYRWHPQIPGLPGEYLWRGEDRHAVIRALAAGVRQVAHGGVALAHQYRPADRTPEAVELARRAVGW